MGLTDDDIQGLNGLVDTSRPLGSLAALKQLSAELANRYIAPDSLTIDTGQAGRALDGHVLLHSSSAVYTHLDRLWPALNGSGALAGRVFGDLSSKSGYHRAVAAFRDPKVVRDMRMNDAPQATIAARVLHCIRVLGQGAMASSQPQVFRSVQRHLTELLLAYPVLMHPKVLLPIDRGGKLEYMSVLHALSVGSGGLPRLSHLVGPTCGLRAPLHEHDAIERLQVFARHPCVRLALRTQTCVHVAIGAGEPNKPRAIVQRPTHLVRFAFAVPSPRVQFLASVMELQTIDGGAAGLPLVDATPETALQTSDNIQRRNVLQTLALSMYAAAGMVHTPANGASATVTGAEVIHPPGVAGEDDEFMRTDVERAASWRHHPSDQALHAALKSRAAMLLREPEYQHAVRMLMSKRVFLGRFDELNVSDVCTNTEAAINGLVESGFETSKADAGACAAMSILGPERPGGALPKAEVQAAVAFLHVVEETGALGARSSPLLQNVVDAVKHFPEHSVAYRDNWALALTVFENTRTVKNALEASRNRLGEAGVDELEPAQPMPERRRSRLAV